jgi:hypothetical protein
MVVVAMGLLPKQNLFASVLLKAWIGNKVLALHVLGKQSGNGKKGAHG